MTTAETVATNFVGALVRFERADYADSTKRWITRARGVIRAIWSQHNTLAFLVEDAAHIVQTVYLDDGSGPQRIIIEQEAPKP